LQRLADEDLVKRALRSIVDVVAGLRRADAVLLLSLLAIVLGLWTFVAVANQVRQQNTQEVDERILRGLRDPAGKPVGPPWLPGVMRDVTALGGATVLVLVVLSVTGALAIRRQYAALALLLAATLGGRFLNAALKDLFARPRPDLALHLTDVRSLSFPSGHAMDSAVIYLTLAALLARLVKPLALKLYVLGLAAFVTFLIGLSRVYLGVHYPSDVLAGWTAGLAWATLCWTLASYLQRRGAVEPAK
jgi:undecaprenyl-diphosphatase